MFLVFLLLLNMLVVPGNINADTVYATSLSASSGNIFATSGNIYLSTTNKELGWTTGNGIIRTIGAGSTLYIKGGNPGENMGVFTEGSSVDLYYDGIKKFETLGTGVTVTGTTSTNQLSVSGNIGINSANPTAKLDVQGGDIKVGINTSTGLILTSPNGTQYRLIIDNSGNLSATAV